MAFIELDGLSLSLGGRPILKELTGAYSGQCIGLLGPNGAGKTTLLQALLGFYPPTSGTARVLGLDVRTQIRQIRHRIGYMTVIRPKHIEDEEHIIDVSCTGAQVEYLNAIQVRCRPAVEPVGIGHKSQAAFLLKRWEELGRFHITPEIGFMFVRVIQTLKKVET